MNNWKDEIFFYYNLSAYIHCAILFHTYNSLIMSRNFHPYFSFQCFNFLSSNIKLNFIHNYVILNNFMFNLIITRENIISYIIFIYFMGLLILLLLIKLKFKIYQISFSILCNKQSVIYLIEKSQYIQNIILFKVKIITNIGNKINEMMKDEDGELINFIFQILCKKIVY